MSAGLLHKGPPSASPSARLDLAVLLFLTLLGSYAYFWQSRDWNSASRLMLTYSMVDRHRLAIDGLEWQAGTRGPFDWSSRRYDMIAGDLAQFRGHFYTDKAPGQSLLGTLSYGIAKLAARLPDHPLHRPALAYWEADYWTTLGSSGLWTAALAAILYAFSLRLGATHLGGMLLGLAYGLGTPAFLYATLFYGHQSSAFCTFASFFLLYRAAHEGKPYPWHMLLAGLLAGYAVVIEYQVGLISALLALYAILALRRPGPVAIFLAAAALAAGLLAAYNYRVFGNPFEMGYAHEVYHEFRSIHSKDNPLGLRFPPWDHAVAVLQTLLWGRYRGLAFYAPIVLAAPAGLVLLLWNKRWRIALFLAGAFLCMLAVNISYPAWTGGWCTGPRFLLPALPFVVLSVAGLLRADRYRILYTLVGVLALAGAILMLGCVAVGGRFPDGLFRDPVKEFVRPHWLGQAEELRTLPVQLAEDRQFEWNLGRWIIEHSFLERIVPPEPSAWQALQMAPLAGYWLLMISLLLRRATQHPAGRLALRRRPSAADR